MFVLVGIGSDPEPGSRRVIQPGRVSGSMGLGKGVWFCPRGARAACYANCRQESNVAVATVTNGALTWAYIRHLSPLCPTASSTRRQVAKT